MGDLAEDTRIEPLGDGRYRADVSRDWEIWGPNGGYMAAIALRAAGAEAAIDRPASFGAHFLSIARFEPVELAVDVLRRGRRAESLRVSIQQGERRVLEAWVRTAAEGEGLEHDRVAPPEVPEPEALRPIEELVPDDAPPPYPFWQNLESRPLEPERFDEPRDERPPGDPHWREWYRFRPTATFDDPWVDAARALLLIDTLSWPAACQPHPNAPFQAPNVDVTTWFHRAAPESEWLLVDTKCDVAEAGLMGTHSRVFGRDGRLLASGGAQLLCARVPG